MKTASSVLLNRMCSIHCYFTPGGGGPCIRSSPSSSSCSVRSTLHRCCRSTTCRSASHGYGVPSIRRTESCCSSTSSSSFFSSVVIATAGGAAARGPGTCAAAVDGSKSPDLARRMFSSLLLHTSKKCRFSSSSYSSLHSPASSTSSPAVLRYACGFASPSAVAPSWSSFRGFAAACPPPCRAAAAAASGDSIRRTALSVAAAAATTESHTTSSSSPLLLHQQHRHLQQRGGPAVAARSTTVLLCVGSAGLRWLSSSANGRCGGGGGGGGAAAAAGGATAVAGYRDGHVAVWWDEGLSAAASAHLLCDIGNGVWGRKDFGKGAAAEKREAAAEKSLTEQQQQEDAEEEAQTLKRRSSVIDFPDPSHDTDAAAAAGGEQQPRQQARDRLQRLLRGDKVGRLVLDILQSRVYEICSATPLTRAVSLAEKTKNTVLLKREDMHSVFSFKIRGAYNKIADLCTAAAASPPPDEAAAAGGGQGNPARTAAAAARTTTRGRAAQEDDLRATLPTGSSTSSSSTTSSSSRDGCKDSAGRDPAEGQAAAAEVPGSSRRRQQQRVVPSMVACCSAGNHAQGVAVAARKLGLRARICMPATAPQIKVKSVQRLGGEVDLGGTFDDSLHRCEEFVRNSGGAAVFIHPFDDPLVVAGQGTVGLEIFSQAKQLLLAGEKIDFIFAPVGGGGLLAGVAAYAKFISPSTAIIGVEAADSAGMTTSLLKGRVTALDCVGTFADGTAVKRVGSFTFDICKELVDGMVTCSNQEICEAIKDAFEDLRVILEPAGALAIAGMKKYLQRHNLEGRNVVAICSGANLDYSRVKFVAERPRSSQRFLRVEIPPPAGKSILKLLTALDSLVVEQIFLVRKQDNSSVVVLESSAKKEGHSVFQRLRDMNLQFTDLGQSEQLKLHGGFFFGREALRTATTGDVAIFCVQFQQTEGKLLDFFSILAESKATVEFLHYVNSGGTDNDILVGVQANEHLSAWLEKLRSAGFAVESPREPELKNLGSASAA